MSMCADKLKYLLLVLFSVMGGILLFGCNTVTPEPDPVSRSVVSVAESWRFLKSDKARAMEPDFDDDAWETVNLPHTWNAEDGADGGSNYYRGTGWYRRWITVSEEEAAGKRIYLEFQGVNSKMELYVNGTSVGTHKGGYTTFRFDITEHLRIGEENLLAVCVSNKDDRTIAPISGDFTFFGGIYRDVSLIFTDEVHIDMLDSGSSGVYLTTEELSKRSAQLRVETTLVNDSSEGKTVSVRIAVKHPDEFEQNEFEKEYLAGLMRFDPEDLCGGGLVDAVTLSYDMEAGQRIEISEILEIKKPHLWNGITDPYRYQVNISVSENDEIIDSVISYIGIREYRVDKDSGFYLNGESYPLRGVAMHQDYEGMGNAVTKAEITESFSLLYEVGANAVRLSHYPHNTYTYELCDKYGIAVYAEIPFVNTYGGSGTYDNPDETLKGFIETTKQQLTEMIKQQYNRSSIFFWGLYNEAQKASHTVMVPLVADLNALAHELDDTRLTVTATFSEEGEALQSDLLAWNTYPAANGLQNRVESFYNAMSGGKISENPDRYAACYIEEYDSQGYYDGLLNRPIALSEYGIGGSIFQHTDDYMQGSGTVKIQTEEYQAYCHETWLNQIKSLDYLWGTFVWNLFDFSADNRDEATAPGVNTKGLVTRDRQTKKDAFYIYKAYWRTDEDVLYLTGKNNTGRYTNPIYFKAYSNCDSVTLFVDDTEIGTIESGDTQLEHVFVWDWSNSLDYGEHTIRVVGKSGGRTVTDEMKITIRKRAVTELESEQLRVNNEEKYICVSPALTTETISSFLSADDGATMEVRESDGLTPVESGAIIPGMTLLVTAEDGQTTALYTFVESTADTRLTVTVAEEETGNPAKHIIDGDPGTRWSGSTGCPTEIVIDLGEPAHLSEISIKWFEARAYRYTIQVSREGSVYRTVANRSENTQRGTLTDSFDAQYVRYIKIRVTGTSDDSDWVSIYEVTTNAWWFHTAYDVNEEARTITVPYDPAIVISKEEFIENLGLEGDCEAEVSTGNDATVYYITDGAVLTVAVGDEVYEYELIYE